ncbi:hypothetical protein GRF29_185g1096387 [Pseudopithomyces chartarum]|uniref:Uncharacterized protein n=1 Tax=Pseudopithomyces chartarum TaxID=1892770 RepID=A0AAN6LNI1_9PLEO|nr:hypothetical protein GRF29_185g1096387 [Pseudopithomyces chartarum]
MGQSQSSSTGQSLGGARPSTATQEPDIDPQERARMQAEERERRAAAVQQRITDQQKRTGGGRGGVSGSAATKKKPNALEQLSAENRGWRAADEQAELRSWN